MYADTTASELPLIDERDERLDFGGLQIQVWHRVRRSAIGSILIANLIGHRCNARVREKSPEVYGGELFTCQIRAINVAHSFTKMATAAAFGRKQA